MTNIDWIGSVGVFLILSAYILNSIGKVDSKDLLFILLNLFGGALACLASVLMKYIPFIILEGAWTLVAMFSLINFMKNRGSILKN